MKPTADKDLNRLVESYVAQGWTVESSRRHVKVKSPMGTGVTLPKTPSDHRTLLNVRAQFRRATRSR